MFVITELIHGNVYALDARGRVWRISGGYDDAPTMELMDGDVGRERINALAEPKLIRWLKD